MTTTDCSNDSSFSQVITSESFLGRTSLVIGTALFSGFLASQNKGDFDKTLDAVNASWVVNFTTLIILSVIIYIIFGWAWYCCYQAVDDDATLGTVDMLFGIGLALFLIWTIDVFTLKNYKRAKGVSVLSFIYFAFVAFYLRNVDSKCCFAFILIALFSLYMAAYTNELDKASS